MTADNYLPVAFYFKVVFSATAKTSDNSFQDVTGISSEIETESYVEGGENRFVHQLPKSVKHPKLVLKRGIAQKKSPLITWCSAVIDGGFAVSIKPKLVKVYLMNEKKSPIRAWSFANAYPVNWEVENFNSTKNEVVIEKIELNYNYVDRLM